MYWGNLLPVALDGMLLVAVDNTDNRATTVGKHIPILGGGSYGIVGC